MQEVVVDGALLHEGALAFADQRWQERGQPIGEELGEDLGKAMNEADWSIVSDHPSVRFFWEQNDVC